MPSRPRESKPGATFSLSGACTAVFISGPMRANLTFLYRGGLVLLAVLAVWLVGAAVVEPANAPPAPAAPAGAPPPASHAFAPSTQDVLTFGLNRIEALQTPLFHQPIWKYIASLLYLVLALYSSKLLNWLVIHRFKLWASKTETRLDDLVLEILHGPIKVVSFVIFLHIGLRLLTWSPWFEDYLSKGLRLVVAWSVTYMVLKGVDLGFTYWRKRTRADEDQLFSDHLFPVIRRMLRALIVVGAVLLTADNLGFKVTSILAGLSIGGLALGLAAQDTVANLFGAVAIFLDKPFRLGDRIKLEAVDGVVETIGLRSTRVRNLDGHLVTIPNKTMGNATITNVSCRPNIKTELNIGVTYDTSLPKMQRALALLNEIFRQHPKTFDVIIGFNRFADSSLNIQVIHWWNGTEVRDYTAGLQQLNLTIMERFAAEGIAMAFPTQTLYLKQDSEWRLSPDPTPPARS